MSTYQNPVLAVEAERLADEYPTCRILKDFGPESPESMRRIGKLVGKVLYGHKWVEYLRELEAYVLNKGQRFPFEWSADSISQEKMLSVFAEAKPANVRVDTRTDEEKAMDEFMKYGGKPAYQRNGRKDNRPIIKPLDIQEFGK